MGIGTRGFLGGLRAWDQRIRSDGNLLSRSVAFLFGPRRSHSIPARTKVRPSRAAGPRTASHATPAVGIASGRNGTSPVVCTAGRTGAFTAKMRRSQDGGRRHGIAPPFFSPLPHRAAFSRGRRRVRRRGLSNACHPLTELLRGRREAIPDLDAAASGPPDALAKAPSPGALALKNHLALIR
jgi:hypothetical protein